MTLSQSQTQNQSRLKTGAPSTEAGAVPGLLEPWLRLCAGNGELLANYAPSFAKAMEGRPAGMRGTNLAGRGTPIDRMIDEATGKLEEEAMAFFDWCRETFERLGWDEEAVDG
jgi:hypothetical protein